MKMKLLILFIYCALSRVYAADLDVTLDTPTSVIETSTVSRATIPVKYMIIDFQAKTIELEFIGIPKRAVRKLTDAQFNNLVTLLKTNYGPVIKNTLADQLAAQTP